jgi:serine/threonine protein kinase
MVQRERPGLETSFSDKSELHADFRSFFEKEDSKSQLSLSVNDSAADKTFLECYEKQDLLGEGGFAVVFRCRHKERDNIYAVKEIENEEYEGSGEGNTIKEEIAAMKRLKEIPYFIRLLDVFKERDKTYLVMEEMKGGDLLDKIVDKEFYTEDEARKTCRRLMEAIYFCHKKHIVHRDIKPENILLENPLDDTKIKLADFGCSKHIKEGAVLVTMCGTPQYVAPEVYLHGGCGYDERCDLWSAAVVGYLLLAGYVPFDGDPVDLPKIVSDGQYEFHDKYWSEITEEPKQFLRDLLRVDPRERASITDVLDSGWLRRQDKEIMRQRSARMLYSRSSSRDLSVSSSATDGESQPFRNSASIQESDHEN